MNHPRLRCILAISASALLNLLLIALLYKEEKSGHWIQKHIHSQVQSDPTERPDYWCIMGWNNTIKKLNIDCDICFFGHSQIAMSDFQQDFPNRKIVTLGYPGDNVDGMLLRVDPIKYIHPEKVFIMCGVNSLGMPDTAFQRKYQLLVDSIHHAVPEATLYLFNILPERDGTFGEARLNPLIRQRNNYIAQYASKKGIICIDLHTPFCDADGTLKEEYSIDGLHINPSGYKLWEQTIRQYI